LYSIVSAMAVTFPRASGLPYLIRRTTVAVRSVSSGNPWIRACEPPSHDTAGTATTSYVNPWRKSTQTASVGASGLCHLSEVAAPRLSASDWQKFSMAHSSSRALSHEGPLWGARKTLESHVTFSDFEELASTDENLEVLDAKPVHSGQGWSTPFARTTEVESASESPTLSPATAHMEVDSDLDLLSTIV